MAHRMFKDASGREWEAWDVVPSKWVGPDLNAEGNEVAIETLEIMHEGIELDKE